MDGSISDNNGVERAMQQNYSAQKEAAAREAVATILKSKDWQAWLVFAEYCADGRNECMLKAGTNEPVGRKFAAAMNAWLADHAWVGDIDKVSRSHAVKCWELREQIEKLREIMGSNERQRKNHPTTMLRAYERSLRESEKAPKKATVSKSDLEQQLALMSDERDKWRKKAESADMLFDLKGDPVKTIVPIIASEVSMNKLGELAKALKAEFDRRSKIKNGAAK